MFSISNGGIIIKNSIQVDQPTLPVIYTEETLSTTVLLGTSLK
jgi:hypothetical protein